MMNAPRLLMLLACAALVACEAGDDNRQSSGTSAATARSETPQEYADGNRDGRVTRAEAQADPYLAASFDRYDANGNDELDRAEFARLEAASQADQDQAKRHQLRPRSEYPRPYQ